MRAAHETLSVLLIEDEPLISLDLCETLIEAGFHVIGPANTASGALFLLNRDTPQIAIVDVLLRDGGCGEVVQQLRQRGVPFLVHSGYPQSGPSASDYQDAPWLAKPAYPADLLALLDRICEPEMAS